MNKSKGSSCTNLEVRDFWEKNPVAASAIDEKLGDRDYFVKFDGFRELPHCEPYMFSNKIHDYESAQGKRILDVGCGNGYVLAQYVKNGGEVYGIDLTEAAVDLSRKRFGFTEFKGEFKHTDGDSISYPDNMFDIVCAMGVLHHIADPKPMINEMYRVLKPGGKIILMLYNKRSYKNLVVFPIMKVFSKSCRGMTFQEIRNMNDGKDCPLAMVYSRQDARRLLKQFESLSFDVNKLGWHILFFGRSFYKHFERISPVPPRFLTKWLGWNLYVTAKKPLHSH